jgi:ABC-type phosphate transport system substrate-binding protein
MNRQLLHLVLGAILPLLTPLAHAQVLVIANPGIAASDVSKSDLRDLFTGASSTLKGGTRVVPVLLKDGSVHAEMLSLYVGKSDSAFRANWRSLLFSGEGVMPRTLDSEAAVVEYVARTPGAIGYISRTTPHDGVKILVVR